LYASQRRAVAARLPRRGGFALAAASLLSVEAKPPAPRGVEEASSTSRRLTLEHQLDDAFAHNGETLRMRINAL